MSASVSGPDLQIVAPRQPIAGHLRDLWGFRELFGQLVKKELKVRYKSSALGFLWSMLNPLFLLVVYTVVFGILGASFSYFSIWLLTGLLAWNFFSTSLMQGTHAITGNSYLVAKVRFPREILPIASVGAALVHLALQSSVLVGVLLVIWYPVDWSYIWLVVPAVAVLILLGAAFAIMLSAMNVYARDTGHLLELAMLAWFFLTPILYPYELVANKLAGKGWPSWLGLLNPITGIVIAIQRGVYGHAAVVPDKTVGGTTTSLLPDESQWWYLRNIAVVGVVATVLFLLAIKLFDKAEGNFAEVM
jgi:ABC-2 type transport system permease protein